MISRVRVRNYQCHKKLTLTLGRGVTTIVGPSDVGKSAVLRALRWLATNKPRGQAFTTRGAKYTSVAAVVDGKRVKRTKGKVNAYDVDGLRLKAFGTEPPSEVTQLLNLGPVNLQGQHDAIFWFSKSPGEVSRELNQIVDLSVIDSTLAALVAETRKNRTALGVSDTRLQAAKARVKEFAPAERASRHLGRLVRGEKRLARLQTRLDTLSALMDRIHAAETQLHRLTRALEHADRVEWLASKVERLGARATGLEAMLHKARALQRTLQQGLPDLTGLEALAEQLTQHAQTIEALTNLLCEVSNFEGDLARLDRRILDLDNKLRAFRGQGCPVCGQKIP